MKTPVITRGSTNFISLFLRILKLYVPVFVLCFSKLSATYITFSGGNGSPLTITFPSSVTFNVTGNSITSGIYVIRGLGLSGSSIYGSVSSTVNISKNGGSSLGVPDSISSLYGNSDLQSTDVYFYLFSAVYQSVVSGDTFVLTAGSITTGGNYAAAPPANGDYTMFLSDNYGHKISNFLSSPPVITSSTVAQGSLNSFFTYQITATNSPTSYSAVGLPPGLSINTSTGLISGTPLTAGSTNVSIKATNGGGDSTIVNLVITIMQYAASISITNTTQTYTGKPIAVTATTSPSKLNAATVYFPGFNPPTDAGTYYVTVNVIDSNYYGSQSSVLTILPAAQIVTINSPSNLRVGVPVALSSSSTSNGPITYSVVSGNASISGSTLTAKDTGPIVIQALQAGTNNYLAASATATLTADAYSPAVITSSPANQLTFAGSTATFTVNATGTSLAYQWNLNGNPIAGASSASYVVTATSGSLGNYTCTVSNAAGSVTTKAASLAFNTTHLANLSARAVVGSSNLTVGFVSSGTSAKSILLRGDGPSLANYGVTGVLSNPVLNLFNGTGASLGSNSSWGASSSLSNLFTQVGAFPLTSSSVDAALNQSLNSGSYTAVLSGANSSTGAAMIEIYDADVANATSRLVNISARGMVGAGASAITGGFVIAGNSTETVLIRAVGPTLATYGVIGVLAQPTLSVYDSKGTLVASNTTWGGTAALISAMTKVGAFSLPSSSADSAVLLTLPTGAYTVQVSGVNGTTGNAMVEIYEVSSP